MLECSKDQQNQARLMRKRIVEIDLALELSNAVFLFFFLWGVWQFLIVVGSGFWE